MAIVRCPAKFMAAHRQAPAVSPLVGKRDVRSVSIEMDIAPHSPSGNGDDDLLLETLEIAPDEDRAGSPQFRGEARCLSGSVDAQCYLACTIVLKDQVRRGARCCSLTAGDWCHAPQSNAVAFFLPSLIRTTALIIRSIGGTRGRVRSPKLHAVIAEFRFRRGFSRLRMRQPPTLRSDSTRGRT